MQLLRDNTVSIRKVTESVSLMLDDSMEKYCKLAFAADQIAFPCCLMVLPYVLNFDESINRPVAAQLSPMIVSCAVKLGKHLLEINKATARLSFWLMMSKKMRGPDGDIFKSQMQEWLKRARYESCSSIALEIVTGLGCKPSYAMVCEEVLAFDGNISKAKSYMRDPIRAAQKEIKQNSDGFSELYQSMSYLYLVDEAVLVPSYASRKNRESPYPIELEPNPKLIARVLLPFMNIVVMKALARNGFEGLASLIGLPPSLGIPESWMPSKPGLLHSLDNPSSIEEFVSLQRILRKDDLNALRDDGSVMSKSFNSGISSVDNASFFSLSALRMANIELSPGDPAIASIPMAQLELLFRERDPDREFANLKRITSGSQNTTLGLWTSTDAIRQLKNMVDVSELEERLRELKLKLDQTQDAAVEYANLLNRRRMMKSSMPANAMSPIGGEGGFSFENAFDDHFVQGNDSIQGNASSIDQGYQQHGENKDHDEYARTPVIHHQQHYQQQRPGEEQREDPGGPGTMPQYEDKPLEIETHRMQGPRPLSDIDEPHTDPAATAKKMRKSKRRFRPWFTAC